MALQIRKANGVAALLSIGEKRLPTAAAFDMGRGLGSEGFVSLNCLRILLMLT